MSASTRRAFTKASLSSVLTLSLLEVLFERDAFGGPVQPITEKWLKEVVALSQACRGRAIKQTEWQQQIDVLFDRIELAEMLRLVDFEKATANAQFRPQGERSFGFQFPEIEGLPRDLAFGKQIFGMRKGQSVIPHGHNNMATAFFVLDGQFHGRHYDRLRDDADVMIIRPTIDRNFGVAEHSTISDTKDNVHWFRALTKTAFLFNIHVRVPQAEGEKKKRTGRVYIDPAGEALQDGTIAAPFAKYGELLKKYG